jgi:hypothetical protein
MGTRSDIIVQNAAGQWARIYCHWDGYLEHNGRILFDHYTTQAHADALIAGGDLSSLAPSPAKPDGHTFDKPVDGHCVFYGRDRGEPYTAAKVGDALQAVWPEKDCWTEFAYVWTAGRWYVGNPDEGSQALIDLGDALTGKTTLTPGVKLFGAVIGQHAPHNPAKPDQHGWHSHI